MRAELLTTEASAADEKRWYFAGGVSAIALGLSYVVVTAVYVSGGALPNGTEAWLRHLAAHTTAWWTILALSVLTDFLFLPVAASLYLALKDVHRTAMAAGAGLLAMFAVLDLAVTWPNYASLITLSGRYAARIDDAQRAAVVAAATYATSVLTSGLFTTYAILVPSIAILIIGLVMLKSRFSRVTAWTGVASGVLGIASVVGPIFVSALGAAVIVSSILTTIWLLLLGQRLCTLP